jgi:hypothetical protein
MSDWKWASGQFNLKDGQICWQPATLASEDLSSYIKGLASSFKVSKQSSQTPDTLLWELTAPVPKANGNDQGLAEHLIGDIVKSSRWFATIRLMNAWIAPRKGTGQFEIDKDTVQLAFLRDDGVSVVLLALSGIDDTSSFFRSNDQKKVVLHTRNESDSKGVGTILVAVAKSYDLANAAVMYAARGVADGSDLSAAMRTIQLDPTTPSAQDLVAKKNDIKPAWFEEWVDGFGFCTWNSLGQGLTEEKILGALKSFRDHGIIITNLIIDDNWQSRDHDGEDQVFRGMTRFEADPQIFPNGLKSTISKIKEQNPSITQVAVWHTLLGYWGAISPTGELAKRYKTTKVQNQAGWKWTCIAVEDVDRFYADFYAFLRACGVDGVKTDAQMAIDEIQDAPDRRTLIKAYQDAWTLEGLRYLGARQISCSSQCPVILFHSLMSTTGPRIVLRNSDDFFPEVDSSHPWHIFANANNALTMQHLNVVLDWDMFQSSHSWAGYHAAARCISGGPVYITDYPNDHNKQIISQIAASTTRGSTVILRPSRTAKASNPYIAYEDPKFLKLDTYHGPADTGVSIVGVFSVSQCPLSELMSLSEFSGTENGAWVIRSYIEGKASSAMKRGDKKDYVQIDLDFKGYDVLTAFPVTEVAGVKLANLGLIDKFSGGVAVEQNDVGKDSKGRPLLTASLRALGVWGVWIDALPKMKIEDDLFLTMSSAPIPLEYVRVSKRDAHVLEVDLEKLWKDGEFESGWGNEVAVQLLITKV